jgi:4-hydroxybenzoate polyprenyltransferase
VQRFATRASAPSVDKARRQEDATKSREVNMAVLWALVVLLILFAIIGGAAFNSWLFLIIVIALILALAGAF